eukprot:m.463160 g.463160  ORF g.463160 m.463160 type:complete len:178 (-) comp57030_c0_seq6:71-604(-)
MDPNGDLFTKFHLMILLLFLSRADVWSVACILVECLTRTVLFRGNDTIDQFVKIVTRRGFPHGRFLALIESAATRAFIQRYQDLLPEPWERILPGVHDETLFDLLDRMLSYDPAERLTAGGAMEHPFFEMYHNAEYEPVSGGIAQDWEVDRTLEQWRLLLFAEIQDCRARGTIPDPL